MFKQLQDIEAALIAYNANSSGKNTGDCVKRGISLALGIPYDQVALDLNRKVRSAKNHSSYNSTSTFEPYLMSKGCIIKHVPCLIENNQITIETTVGEFSDTCSKGTYILDCGPKPDKQPGDHIVAVVEGNIYDSWDSSNYYIRKVMTVPDRPSMIDMDSNFDGEELTQYVEDVMEKMKVKYPFPHTARVYLKEAGLFDSEGHGFCFIVQSKYYITLPSSPRLGSIFDKKKKFVIKYVPTSTPEENEKMCKDKIYYYLREFYYAIFKEYQNQLEADQFDIETVMPNYRYTTITGDEINLVKKFPDRYRKYILRIDENDFYWNRRFKWSMYVKNKYGDSKTIYSDKIKDLVSAVTFYIDTGDVPDWYEDSLFD